MATKKTEETAAPELQAAPIDPMQEYATVYLPRATGDEEDTETVGFNGKLYRIQRGASVQVPRPVASLINDSIRQKEQNAAYYQELQRKARERAPQVWW